MKKLFVLFFVFFALPAVVLGTEYTITEAELSRLEEISENLETYKRNQQLSTELEKGIDRSLEQIEYLERSITDGEGDIEELKAILRRIRERARYKNSRIRNLN